MAQSGSIRAVNVDGQDYDAFSDVDLDRVPENTTEMLSTTGQSIPMVTKQNPNVTGFDAAVDGAQRSTLKDVANGTVNVDLAYTDAAGNSYTGSGRINITADNTKEGKLTFDMMPVDGWSEILV